MDEWEDMMTERELIGGLYLSWAQGTALYGRYAERAGVSYSELMVLYAMTDGARTQRDIALAMELTKQTVHAAVKRLIAAGCAVLEADGEDRRRKALRLTAEGEALAARVVTPLKEMEARVCRAVGPERLAAMKETSDRFNALFARELAEADA